MLSRLMRPLARPSALRAAPLSKRPFRLVHTVPALTHQAQFESSGVPDLLSPDAFDFAWTQYQALMVEKLSLLTQDTVDADMKPSDLLIKYSRRPEMASVFNYASMAHNNHFFFNSLSPHHVEIPEKFRQDIIDTCSSVESLKLDFLATANGMFGPGFVWLAKNLEREGLIHIFCTYNAGSPYPAAHARRQPVDMATHAQDSPQGNQHAGSMGSHSAHTRSLAPGAVNVQPILCVNTWEHVWMMDYGIGGKAEYLEKWWDRIDWQAVADNYDAIGVNRDRGLRNQRVDMNMTR